MSYLPGGELVIGPHNTATAVPAGQAMGLIPRDYSAYPRGCYASSKAIDFPLIARSEWPQRIADLEAKKGRLSDLRMSGNNGQMIPSRDQNGKGFCWAHSGTAAVILVRAVMGLPYVSLSAYAIACIIKSYRDEGGWGAQGLDFIVNRGVPSEEFWPQQSMSRANDKPETWENAALHKVTEAWNDLAVAQYDRQLSFDQEGTLLLSLEPVIKDENWWGHSICGCDLVNGSAQRGLFRNETGKLPQLADFDLAWGMNDPVTAGYGVRIWNSWGHFWSNQGMGVLTGSQAVSDGATSVRVTVPSVN